MHYHYVKYPRKIEQEKLDKLLLKFRIGSIAYCLVCGKIVFMMGVEENLRSSCICINCKSSNRQRQVAYVIINRLKSLGAKNIRCLRQLCKMEDIAVYNAEACGALHNAMSKMKYYICSEYCGSSLKSGEMVGNILHQDLCKLSFKSLSFDMVISADVLEHIPSPYDAHKEIYRVLKPGGCHIFSVPFCHTEYLDEKRAIVDASGTIVFLKKPLFHPDPMRPEGALVYSTFSWQMILELAKIGFKTNIYHLYLPFYGIFGSNAIVFEAIKI